MGENRTTRTELNLDGFIIDVTIFGQPNCYPTEEDKALIRSSIKRSSKSGTLASNQPNKETAILGKWKIREEE